MQKTLKQVTQEAQKAYIEQVLKDNKFNVSKSAKILGLHRNNLSNHITNFDIKRNK